MFPSTTFLIALPATASENTATGVNLSNFYYTLLFGFILVLIFLLIKLTRHKHQEPFYNPILMNAFREMSACIILDSKYRIIKINKEFTKLNGYELKDVMRLTPFPNIVFTDSYKEKKQIIASLASSGVWQGELSAIHKSGYVLTELIKIQAINTSTDHPPFYIMSFVDISHQKEIEHQLRILSEKDPLTGLWNRRKFDDELRRLCKLVERYPDKSSACVAMIDIDHFKQINDQLGHDHGDYVIQMLSGKFKKDLRETDIIARVGGEEFAIILRQTSLQDAAYIIDRLRHAIHENHDIPCSISGGITDVTSSPEQVYKRADIALYNAKSAGRNKILPLPSSQTAEVEYALQ
ncbi:sensor domain-containing diguanylate cyclase [Vibrio sp.]|nr:sensor domain-containing diguanylate cyclase [Vibrio sp.]